MKENNGSVIIILEMLLSWESALQYFNSVSLTQLVRRHGCQADAKRHDAQKIEPQLPAQRSPLL